ncbi:MAG TPA: helix-turn-helix transcriptional regulator [Candidatus Hydrogenedentes bacterium]|nr:helix-turn-helix transcriptional regulator [Candidatus Hydrogenedentota bacterium]
MIIRNNFPTLVERKFATEGRLDDLRPGVISRELALHYNAVLAYLDGSIARFDSHVLIRICTWLGCNLSDLLETVWVEENEDEPVTA